MKVYEQLNESNWTKRTFARGTDGFPCSLDNPNAIKFCAYGWLLKVYGEGGADEINTRAKTYLDQRGIWPLLQEYNDREKTTLEDIKQLFQMLDV